MTSHITLRAPEETFHQIDRLQQAWGETNRTQTVIRAIERIYQQEIAMHTKDATKVCYCSAGGHFWRWQWSPEKGGDYFPAYVPDEEAPDDFDEQYCGCND